MVYSVKLSFHDGFKRVDDSFMRRWDEYQFKLMPHTKFSKKMVLKSNSDQTGIVDNSVPCYDTFTHQFFKYMYVVFCVCVYYTIKINHVLITFQYILVFVFARQTKI